VGIDDSRVSATTTILRSNSTSQSLSTGISTSSGLEDVPTSLGDLDTVGTGHLIHKVIGPLVEVVTNRDTKIFCPVGSRMLDLGRDAMLDGVPRRASSGLLSGHLPSLVSALHRELRADGVEIRHHLLHEICLLFTGAETLHDQVGGIGVRPSTLTKKI